MKTKLLFIIALGISTSCQENKPTDDPEKLKTILVDYFDGIKKADLKKMNDLTTADFVLYEDGKIWNNDSLMNLLKQYPNFKAEYKFDNFKINVDNASGDMTYLNHGDFVLNDTTKMSMNWVESATFRKVEGNWKMNFLHSTIKK